MSTSNSQKYSFSLIIGGCGLIFLGAALGYINSRFDFLSLLLISGGGLCLLVALFSSLDKIIHFFASSHLGKEIPGAFTVVVAFALLLGVNYFAAKYSLRVDVTQFKQHTLTNQTIQIIKNLKDNIKITVFYVGIAPNYLTDLLGEYERFSFGHIKTEIIDPLVQIGYAVGFGNVITGNEKKAIVVSSKERKDLDFKDKPLNEEDLTNTIIKTIRDKRKIYFLTGHDEYSINDGKEAGFSILRTALENSNSETKTLLLGVSKDVPEDCDVLIIAGAKNPLSKEEESALQLYLEKGGKALFLIESMPVGNAEHPLTEADKLKNPTLNTILNKWGINANDDIVVDIENHIGGDVGCPATKNYPAHKEIVNNLDYTFYIRPRSLSLSENYPQSVKIAPLVFTASSKNSWAETDKNLQVKFDEGKDTPGPVPIAAVIWGPKTETKKSDTKIIVFADADFATNKFIGQYSNAAIILNSISWLSELDNLISIPSKNISVSQLNLTSKQLRTVVVILWALPLLILAWGAWSWRKNAALS